jgi:Fe-S-cluster containining protein
MDCSNCGVCCAETEMLLSKKDIERLKSRGFNESYFAQFGSDGYMQLKNHDGYCVFYDRQNRRCRVYADRPAGCRVYPVILDEEKGIILDDICECRGTINNAERRSKGKRVTELLKKIDAEAAERLRNGA